MGDTELVVKGLPDFVGTSLPLMEETNLHMEQGEVHSWTEGENGILGKSKNWRRIASVGTGALLLPAMDAGQLNMLFLCPNFLMQYS